MEKPNWRVWLSKPEVEVWQACVLSVGLEPSSMKAKRDSWMHDNGKGPHLDSKSFPNPEIEKDYRDLLEVLTANLIEHKPFNVLAIPRLGRGFCNIRLDVFVAWATSKVDWLKLPPEMLPPKRVTKESDLKIKDERTFRFLCPVENNDYNNFGGYTLKGDGLYINQAMIEYCKSCESTLNEDETYELLWHPTGDYAQPVLKFDCCTLTDLRAFALNSSLDCIDEDAVAELLAKPPEVNPPSASNNAQTAPQSLQAQANSEDGENSAIGLIGQKGRQAQTDKKMFHINATNRLGDGEIKITFKSLEEAQASIVLRYAALKADTRLNNSDAVLDELHRLIGCDTIGDSLYARKHLASNITKWRLKTQGNCKQLL